MSSYRMGLLLVLDLLPVKVGPELDPFPEWLWRSVDEPLPELFQL